MITVPTGEVIIKQVMSEITLALLAPTDAVTGDDSGKRIVVVGGQCGFEVEKEVGRAGVRKFVW
jgi:hypothetical protein